MRKRIYEVIELAKEKDRLSAIYDSFMILVIVLSLLPLLYKVTPEPLLVLDKVCVGIFLVDYLLRWVTSVIRSEKHSWVAAVRYPFTPMAIIDLLSILPTINLLTPTFKVARVSRLLRLLRVVKVIRYFEPLEIIITVIKKQMKILQAVLSVALFYIFVTAMIMFNAEEDINPETGEYLFESFFDAFYWASCTLTTVGYGDLYPISTTGRVISIISSMVGIAIIALPSGVITAGYLDELRERKKNEE